MVPVCVACGRYTPGVTCSRPLLRPRWCSKTIGAPSKGPPTLPWLARNSATVRAFQSSVSLMSHSPRLGAQDDRAVGVTAFQLDRREGEGSSPDSGDIPG